MDMNMDMAASNQLAGLNPIMLENFQFTDFSVENFLAHQQPEFPGSSTHNFLPSNFQADHMNAVPVLQGMPLSGDVCHPRKKRKVMEQSNTSSKIISSMAFGDGYEANNDNKRKKSLGKGKNNEKEVKNSEEVIHVRARRGQATDSHSLAERVRRQKISNKLRRLQELVPGCYKTMGMAVMLDEIINYVHSLQNQVEFLSMELASATSSYDFNPETDAISRRKST